MLCNRSHAGGSKRYVRWCVLSFRMRVLDSRDSQSILSEERITSIQHIDSATIRAIVKIN